MRFIGIDADPDACRALAGRAFGMPCTFLPVALGAVEGPATLHLTKQRGCSSVLQPNTAYLRRFPYGDAFTVEAELPVTLTTLDKVRTTHALPPVDVLKIDTQGSELDILRGARETLVDVSLIESEVEFNPLYVGQPLFGDMDRYLREQGFTLLGLRRTAWRRDTTGSLGGTVVHGDALWLRDEIAADRRDAIAIALMAYHQHDTARALGGHVNGHDSRSTVQRIIGRLAAQFGSHRQARAWIDRCRIHGAKDWHDAEFF
jgi:FkbM family methyltransferase